MNVDAISEQIERHRVRMIDLKFSDLYGAWRHITLPAGRMSEGLMEGGVGFDGSSVGGFRTVERSDLRAVPDPSTAFIDPFLDAPTLSMISDVVEAGTGTPFPLDPRGVARRAAEYLRRTGIADEAVFSPEPEFHLFEGVDYGEDNVSGHYLVYESGDAPAGPQSGYHSVPPLDPYHDLRTEIVEILENLGIAVKYHHHESGFHGQSEIEVRFQPLVKTGDLVMMLKYAVRNVARRHGKTATFMPRPLAGEAGNGMHVHQKLLLGERPVFYREGGYADLSPEAMFYIGGLLFHGPALAALVCPTTNSYRRLVPGFEAPVTLAFAQGNRTAAVRIPAYAQRPEDKSLEFRPSDPSANIYLALSALMMAGLSGIQHRIDPVERGMGPYDVNIYQLPEEVRARIGSLPESLEEAVDALQSDHAFLLEGGVFTSDLIAAWVESRLEMCRDLRTRPHPHEYITTYST